MKLKEVFERTGMITDSKARRIVNASDVTANITADEIERGVSLERLSTIGVPVFRYATQITIHGLIPGFSDTARPVGYKSVTRNSNGTVGVRYVAVDGEKKALIREASLYGTKGWTAGLVSTGLTVSRYFESRDDAVAAFRHFPRNLVYGSVQAGAGVYGGYYVVADIGAIPTESLWGFISLLWGIASPGELARRVAAADAERERRTQRAREENDALRAKRARERADVAARLNLPRLSAAPKGPCRFVRVTAGLVTAAQVRLCTVERRGPTLCIRSAPLDAAAVDPLFGQGKFRKMSQRDRDQLEADCREGFIFAAPESA